MCWLANAAAFAACFGLVQHFAGWFAVVRFADRMRAAKAEGPRARSCPAITVLKPLHGDEPLLETALASFCAQDYPNYQIVFGVHDAADSALAVARRLASRHPHCDIAIVVEGSAQGVNRKVANLMNMLPRARHRVLLISDADVHAPPDFLARVAAALERPGTGLVTALYYGLPAGPGFVPRLGATQITHAFLPGVLLGRALGRQDCLGAAMALRRETLEAIGGFGALVGHLADDAVLGMLVRARGQLVELCEALVGTTVAEATLAELWRHELRWARTMRSLAPAAYAASALQYPLFWAALAVVASAGAGWALGLFTAAWAIRAAAARGNDRALRLTALAPIWLLPLRDLISSLLILASFAGSRVEWRGQVLRADRPRAVLRSRIRRGMVQQNQVRGEIAPR